MAITPERLQELSERMQMIADDTESDVRAFDGKPFSGSTVAEYFGVIGAQVQSLALSMKELIDDEIDERKGFL